MPSSTDELAARLTDVLGGAEVTDLVRLTGGASRETFRFDADGRPLILQRQRRGAERVMSTEISVLRAAHAAGVPVPTLVTVGDDSAVLGAPFMIVTAVEGETIARKILRDERFASARRLLPAQLGAALAELHSIDPSAVDGLEATDQLTQYRTVLDELAQPHPTFELAFGWLEENRPAAAVPAVVHGDFRLGNVIVTESGLAAVLDWELAHLGDPMEDLGWLCVKAWRFGGELPVAGLGDRSELFDAYEAASGVAVDPQVVRWWEVLGTLKWGIICIAQGNAHRSGAARSHELAAIGRRVCENEWDLFLALEGAW